MSRRAPFNFPPRFSSRLLVITLIASSRVVVSLVVECASCAKDHCIDWNYHLLNFPVPYIAETRKLQSILRALPAFHLEITRMLVKLRETLKKRQKEHQGEANKQRDLRNAPWVMSKTSDEVEMDMLDHLIGYTFECSSIIMSKLRAGRVNHAIN